METRTEIKKQETVLLSTIVDNNGELERAGFSSLQEAGVKLLSCCLSAWLCGLFVGPLGHQLVWHKQKLGDAGPEAALKLPLGEGQDGPPWRKAGLSSYTALSLLPVMGRSGPPQVSPFKVPRKPCSCKASSTVF